MAVPGPFQPVLPFVGVLYIDEEMRDRALILSEKILGPLEYRSEPVPFDYTDYYEAEMGTGIMRMWAGSSRIADPSELSKWKLTTDRIEREISIDEQRTVNLDPGFVGLSKVLLASLKDHPQRVPLRDAVYAEIELTFSDGSWHELPWTYPDYVDAPAKKFLAELREVLLLKLKRHGFI